MNKKLFRFALFLILFLLIIRQAGAIRISPSRFVVAFEPNAQITKSACITPGEPGIIDIIVEGNLVNHVILEKTQLVFNDSIAQCVSYTLSLPEILPPGQNEAIIYAREADPSGAEGSGVGTKASVGQQLWVNVPYPGKYLTATLSANDIEAEKPVDFTITLTSLGSEVISRVSANIELINQNNISLGSLPTTEITNLGPGSTEALTVTWSPSARDVGMYSAIATIYYDGNTAGAETYFKIGELLINLINITSPPIEEGEIEKIDILVESVWIENIPDVYAKIKAAGKTAKSESITIRTWSEEIISVYFSAEGLDAGEYPATAVVYYSDKTAEKEFTITVFEDKTFFYFMVGGSIVLMILIFLIIIFFIKQREYKRKMQHALYLPQ